LSCLALALLWAAPLAAQEHAPATPQNAAEAPANAPAPHGAAETTNAPAPHGAPEQPHAAEPHAATEGAHAGEGHGEAHGGAHEGEHEEGQAFSIHLNTWITGLLKQFWYRGPATVNAEGAVGAGGAAVQAEALEGQQVEYVWEDHHAHPAKEHHLQATLGQIGGRTNVQGAKTKTVTVGGREVTLLNPAEPVFARQQMFPEGLVASLLTALTIGVVAALLLRNLRRVPTRAQAAFELLYERLDEFVRELIGPHYKRYFPLVGTLFFYILFMNWAGVIPGWLSPTANINVTAGLAVVIILYVQYEGLRVNGLKGYLKHFAGEPWWLAPMNFPLHIIGEVARVLSLSVRLFGNIFGEDVIIVILLGLGLMFTKGLVPFQAPMVLFAVFTGFVQALVFTILTCIYLALMTSHEHHDEHSGAHEDDHGHIQEAHAPAPAV
jgi:F-type H+-transporting ATPase subunit a